MCLQYTCLECPLGLQCTQFGEKNEYGAPLWWGCPNRNYCIGVCEAWEIPLEIDDDCTRVELFLPHNYDEKSFTKEMKQYGYAEAEGLPYHRGQHYDFYIREDELLVIRNKFKYGFAMPINLTRKSYHNRYIVDKNGLWWCTLGRPPRIC